ncbi:hypothetical protein GCM10028822_32440 [Hymenobacter terrigena]
MLQLLGRVPLGAGGVVAIFGRGQQAIAAHVQQHQVGVQRHCQPGRVRKSPVRNRKKIGEDDEGGRMIHGQVKRKQRK